MSSNPITSANPSTSYGERTDRIINSYLDSILHDFRQLRVWEEHLRRSGDDGLTLRATYQNWNESAAPELYTGLNDQVLSANFTVNFEAGTLTVNGDSGVDDYFATYEFNLFPANDLKNLIDLSLQEINATVETGGHLTSYTDVDQAPEYYDAAITMGVAAKAFQRLARESNLWKNNLIWVDGQSAQGAVSTMATDFQRQFEALKVGVKKGRFLAKPGTLFNSFRGKGFLGFARGYGAHTRVNRLGFY